jgi:hypothetical protein
MDLVRFAAEQDPREPPPTANPLSSTPGQHDIVLSDLTALPNVHAVV